MLSDISDITVKQLSKIHINQYNELLRYAFQVTEKTLLDYGWENDEIRKSKYPVLEHAYVLGCFDEENLVSQFAVYPLEMNVHEVPYSIGFITSVATYPEYSGMGLMSKLMKQCLTNMREQGQSLALLYPYSIPLYRHRGWEIISDMMTWRISDTQLPQKIEVPGYVRRVQENSADLIQLHACFAKKTHGCLFRNSLAWEEYWRWEMDDTIVSIYYSESDEPLGYMVFRIDKDIMYIKEMIWLNQEAKKGLFRYVSAHESMVEEVRGNNYHGEPIAFSLYDSDIKETIRPYIMGRIIDIAQFIEQYHFKHGTDGAAVTLHVQDPFLEWNNRSFTIKLKDGRGQIVEEESPNQAALSIGTLTTLLLGYKRAPELASLELLQADEQTIQLLDAIIIRKKPYISDYI